MKPKVFLSILALGLILSAFGQKLSLDLTFTAVNSVALNQYVQLDSIKVMNRSKGYDTVQYWPDTTLSIEITTGDTLLYIGYSTGFPVGIQEINQEMNQFQLFQNYPNPVKDQSIVSLYNPEKGTVNVILTDIQGRTVFNDDWQLDEGHHSFRFTPGQGNFFFLTARHNGISKSIKILTTGDYSGRRCAMEYTGSFNGEPPLKSSSLKIGLEMQESGIVDNPDANETYTFQFATNIPCPGTPTVIYEGQVYNTIQIFSQCWLKENLNVGTMIPGDHDMTDNDTIEKYCYDNEPDSCTKYGGLYQWDEMMQYTTQQGGQGICPPGWHLPTDEEWKVLEGAVDSQYGIGDQIWDLEDFRGFDAGTNLKTITGWNGTDLYEFSGLPGGRRVAATGIFTGVGGYAPWWTSSEVEALAWHHDSYSGTEVRRLKTSKEGGHAIRCLKD